MGEGSKASVEVMFFAGLPQVVRELVVYEYENIEEARKDIPGFGDPKIWVDVKKDGSRFETWNVFRYLRDIDVNQKPAGE